MPHMNRTSPVRLQADERRHQAIRLRLRGCTYRSIAETLVAAGHASPSYSERSAYRDVVTALERIAAERGAEVEQARTLELERLDALQERLWPMALAGDLGAVDRVLNLMTLRARILGLLQPQTPRMAVAGAMSADGAGVVTVQLEWGDGSDTLPAQTIDAADPLALPGGEPAA